MYLWFVALQLDLVNQVLTILFHASYTNSYNLGNVAHSL